jgi:hypothetical protein
MNYPYDFALLAPVLLEHLKSAVSIAQNNGFVAFGSMKFEFFRELKKHMQESPVRVMLYASHEGDSTSPPFQVAWSGWFIGSEEIRGGKSASEWGNRPPSCKHYPKDNAKHWAVFWHIRELEPLPIDQHFPIYKTQGYNEVAPKKDSPPRYPQLIRWPVNLESN